MRYPNIHLLEIYIYQYIPTKIEMMQLTYQTTYLDQKFKGERQNFTTTHGILIILQNTNEIKSGQNSVAKKDPEKNVYEVDACGQA